MKKQLELKAPFVERMKELLPDEKDFESYMHFLKNESPVSMRCNTLKITPDVLKKRLESKDWKISQPFKEHPEIMIVEGRVVSEKNRLDSESLDEDSHVNNNSSKGWAGGKELTDLEPGELGRSIEHLLGYYYVQEIASMLPVLALNPKPNEIVLDLCASPGSKTTQISASTKNHGTVIANEVSLGRIKILASNTERCGASNVIITKKEGTALCTRFKNSGFEFDKILIDAPCSGEGTLRSSPKTAIMWNPNTIKKLSKIQKHLVESAIEILKVGGTLVYSTCTHAPEENEEVVDFVIKNFDNMDIERVRLPIKCRRGLQGWAGEVYSNEVQESCRIYPQDSNTEGFFIAKFRKVK